VSYLACDIGNSFIKFGLYTNGELKFFHKIAHSDFSNAILSKLEFDRVGITSVVPERSQKLIKLFETQFNITPFVITHESHFQFENLYGTPDTVGTDRLCGLEGAMQIYFDETGDNTFKDKVLVTIDFGTATTINIIESPAKFVGGLIAPGMTTMSESLSSGTSQLPAIDFSNFENIIGTNTDQCIANGIVNATVGMIERTLEFLIHKNSHDILIFTTGGNAKLISIHLSFEHRNIEDLVLRGVNSLITRLETFEK